MNMIELAIGWIEICTIPSARIELVSNQVDLAWLRRYLLPSNILADRVNEILANLKK